MKKLFLHTLVIVAAFALSACQSLNRRPTKRQQQQARQQQMQQQQAMQAMQAQQQTARRQEERLPRKPVILCRTPGCTRSNPDMSHAFIRETISHLFYINDKTQVLLCEADPITRDCRASSIRYTSRIGETGAIMDVSSFIITDAVYSTDLSRVIFSMNFDIYANGVKSPCNASRTAVEVNDMFQAMLLDDGFSCEFQAGESSRMRFNFNIDYVDLDHAQVGGFYSTGLAEEQQSSSSRGYVLMKLRNKPGRGRPANPHQDAIDCDDEDSIPEGQYRIMPMRNSDAPSR
ncbi:MAG: hypothetical protein FWD15_05990 [Alphaproteobacteria bacterium]|nr:hypothetical protein [Alphaproteobacteria bacterium]